MDPLRSDPRPEALSGAERDARIERLLLSGLDHYFATDYDQAINLWTRVLFFDRHHARARAYIERARSAQAERQRESEALLHQGLEAFQAGEVERARQLLGDALERGASRDLALGVLDRLDRLGARQTAPGPGPVGSGSWPGRGPLSQPRSPIAKAPGRGRLAGATVLLVLAALGAVAVGLWGVTLPDPAAWHFFSGETRSGPPLVPALAIEPLPVPGATETFLSRGRAHFASGRLRDALRELDRVPLGDPLRPEADSIRAEIQRELLGLAAAAELGPGIRGTATRPGDWPGAPVIDLVPAPAPPQE